MVCYLSQLVLFLIALEDEVLTAALGLLGSFKLKFKLSLLRF